MRGEYLRPGGTLTLKWELPPHARRIPFSNPGWFSIIGTTSACAENTRNSPIRSTGRRNYLRMRGEYYPHGAEPVGIRELPPHARRILTRDLEYAGCGGTTSACAENTNPELSPPRSRRNYLRMRGEYSALFHPRLAGMELPPHARRIQRSFSPAASWHGTTSACAENTISKSQADLDLRNYLRMRGEYRHHAKEIREGRNYLRMRGEYQAKTIEVPYLVELPPHARRILCAFLPHTSHCGTTSACAENTRRCVSTFARTRNYLRMRGEYAGKLP